MEEESKQTKMEGREIDREEKRQLLVHGQQKKRKVTKHTTMSPYFVLGR